MCVVGHGSAQLRVGRGATGARLAVSGTSDAERDQALGAAAGAAGSGEVVGGFAIVLAIVGTGVAGIGGRRQWVCLLGKQLFGPA
jgi:hypothetical protein